MPSKPRVPLYAAGKLKNVSDLCGKKPAVVAKLVLYLCDMLAVMDAIAGTTADDLHGVGDAGNHHGRCVAAIARAWMKGRRSNDVAAN